MNIINSLKVWWNLRNLRIAYRKKEVPRRKGVIKIRVPRKGKRQTRKLGKPLGLEDIERSIERGLNDCLRS